MALKQRSQHLKVPGTVYTVVIEKDERKIPKGKWRLIIKLRGRSDGEIPIDNLVAPQIGLEIMEVLKERNVKFVESAIFALSENLIRNMEGKTAETETYGVVEGQRTKITEKIPTKKNIKLKEIDSEKLKEIYANQEYIKNLDVKLGSIEHQIEQLTLTLNNFIENMGSLKDSSNSVTKTSGSSFEDLVDAAKKKRLQ